MLWNILFGLLGVVVVLTIIVLVIIWGAVAISYAYSNLREIWDYIKDKNKR